ncbi:MAG: tetratricopeptide repeat protein [Planctomycetota bacterium]
MFGNKKTAKPAKASPTPDAATSAEGVAEDASAVAEAGEQGEDFKADPRKASRFFQHAETVSDARNYDYAVTLYGNGLKLDPDNFAKHQALHDVGKRRKVGGGKPAGMMERMKSGGSATVDKMAHAARLSAMNPIDAGLLRTLMKHCVAMAEEFGNLPNMADVAHWAGTLALEFNTQAKKPDKDVYKDLRDLFPRVGDYDKAVEACRYMVRLKPDDAELLRELKNLEAEATMNKSYDSGDKVTEGGFRKFVKDADKQRALEQDDATVTSKDQADEIIARRRAELDEDPEDVDKLNKLVRALLGKEIEESENEAIALLDQAHERTGQYRYKVQVGDVRIKQHNRAVRTAKAAYASDKSDANKQAYQEVIKKKLVFEIHEYTERVKKYPTDLALKYELGRRMFQAGKVEEAIGLLQDAKRDPKHRAVCHQYLGECYLKKGWLDEAVETLREGKEAHRIPDDRLAKELLYLLATAETELAARDKSLEAAQVAQKTASSLLQMDINYKDIKSKVDAIRELANELRG